MVAKAIVQAVHQQDPPGRFIKLVNGDGFTVTSDSIWKPITTTQAINKTSQTLREKNIKRKTYTTSNNNGNNSNNNKRSKNNDDTDIMNNIINDSKKKKQHQQQQQQNHNRPMSVLSASSVGNYDVEGGGGQGQKRRPSIVTPGVASFVVNNNDNNNKSSDSSRSNSSNKRTRVQKEGGGRSASASGIITRRASIIDPLPLPTQPLEERQSTLFRFLNNTGIFGRGNNSNSNNNNTTTYNEDNNNIDPISLPENIISQNVSQLGHDNSSGSGSGSSGQQGQDDVFALNSQQSVSGMFNFSRPGQQQQQQQPGSLLSSQGQGPMGRMTVEQFRELQVQKQQQQVQKFAGGRSGDAEEEDLQEISTFGLLTDNNSNNDNDIVAGAAAPSTKGLTSQASDWMASLFSATNSKPDGTPRRKFPPINNGNNNDDEDGAAIPPPPGGVGGGGDHGNPSLGRSVSSTIFGLVESPSLLLNSLKSGISSMFRDPFAPIPVVAVSSSTPMRRFPNNEQQHFGGNVANRNNIGEESIGNPILGQVSEKRASLLDDVEDTPMEKQLRENVVNGNTIGGRGLDRNPILGQARERRPSLLDDFEDTPMEKQLRNAKR